VNSVRPGQTVVLLGPQTREPILQDVLAELGIDGRIAIVTAGWQEREDETLRLSDHLGGRADFLELHRRSDDAFHHDAELADLHRERQDRLQELQSLYNVRLDRAAEAVLDLAERTGTEELVAAARRDAMETVRRIDTGHLEKIRATRDEFDERLRFADRPSLRKHRREVAAIVEGADGLAIAGGHVAVLLNRLRMFGVADVCGSKPVVGWSAGAMVLCERIVVYHDTPPQGPGNAEVLEEGLGFGRGVIALPHARSRLRLDDSRRVTRFAERWTPDRCVALDEGARLTLTPDGWSASPGTCTLEAAGTVEELVA
jgi:hypothetical protein